MREIKVCTKKECRRLGSQKTFEFLEARGEKFDLKVTAVKCLSECGMGPNVELPCGTILNRVKGEESCLKALARTVNEGEECGAFM
jgi:NADH:ubiquinone oxidoreductase subunit E